MMLHLFFLFLSIKIGIGFFGIPVFIINFVREINRLFLVPRIICGEVASK